MTTLTNERRADEATLEGVSTRVGQLRDDESVCATGEDQRVRQIIGLTGYAGAGKNNAADGLVSDGWTAISFADPIREALLALNPYFKCQDGFETLDVEIELFGWDG